MRFLSCLVVISIVGCGGGASPNEKWEVIGEAHDKKTEAWLYVYPPFKNNYVDKYIKYHEDVDPFKAC